MKCRQLVILGAAGTPLKIFDVSDLEHSNTMAPLYVVVRTYCDMEEPHNGQQFELLPWGRRITEGTAR